MYEPMYYYVLGRCVEWNRQASQFLSESEAFYDFVHRTYSKVRAHVVDFAKLDASYSDFEVAVAQELV